MNINLWFAHLFRQVFVGVWSTNWPLILLPFIACICAERLSLRLNPIPYGSNQKHRLAILLSMLPGLVFLSLGIYALDSFRHAEVDSALCVMVFVVPIIIFFIGLCRAALSWLRQRLIVRQLLRETLEADHLIRDLASRLNMTVRILPTDYLACMTVGITRPVVLISSGAVNQLSLPELRAVLIHEQVHVKRKDTLWAAIGKIIAACAFTRTIKAEEVARRAREISADEETSRTVDRLVLASVLIKFARHSPTESYAFAESFACPSTVSERVEHLLSNTATEGEQRMRSLTMKSALACTLILYPYIVHLIAAAWLHC